MIFLHVTAMAFFLGGQIMLAVTVVPVERDNPDPARMKAIARRFGAGSLVALSVLVLTGLYMASHFDLWGNSQFQLKMVFALLTIILLLIHLRLPRNHVVMGLTFLFTLATVFAGINLTH